MYLARTPDGSSQVSLCRDSQMEQYLEYGCYIYQQDDEDQSKETLIATPEDGFLVERPTFPVAQSSETNQDAELTQAAKILLGMEE